MDDNKDYWTAFAVGALIGAGATLLLAPEMDARRILDEIKPAMKRARKSGRRVRKEVRDTVRELRRRRDRAFEAATDEMRRAARSRMKQARRVLRRR